MEARKKTSIPLGLIGFAAIWVGRIALVDAIAYGLAHALWHHPADEQRINIVLALALVLLATASYVAHDVRWFAKAVWVYGAIGCLIFALSIIQVYIKRSPHLLTQRETYYGLSAMGVVCTALFASRGNKTKERHNRPVLASVRNPPEQVNQAIAYRRIGVAPSTYVVMGIIAAILVVPPSIGIIAHGEMSWAAVPLILVGIAGYWHFCFQSIELKLGQMVIRRLLTPAQSFSLREITEVRTVWSNGSAYRRIAFLRGEEEVGAINPKLFSLEDLACILNEVWVLSPFAVIDRDTRVFLPHALRSLPNSAGRVTR